MKYWIVAVTGLILTACNSTPAGPQSQALEYNQCVYPDAPAVEAPSWLCSQPVEGLSLSVWGSSKPRAAGPGFATDVATQNARRRLAEVFATRVASEYQQYISERTNDGISLSLEEVKQKTLIETGMTLVGSRVYYTQVSPNQHMYVLVGMDEAAYQRNLDALTNRSIDPDNPEIFREFVLEQAKKRLNSVETKASVEKPTDDAQASSVGYSSYKKSLRDEYLAYKAAFTKRYQAYKKALTGVWGDKAVMPTKKVYVDYSDDLQQRVVIDYENQTLDIDSLSQQTLSVEDVKKQLQTLAETSVAEQAANDPVLQLRRVNNTDSVLATWATEETVDALLARSHMESSTHTVQVTRVGLVESAAKRQAVTAKRLHRMRLKLPENMLYQQRAKAYLDDVKVIAERLQLPENLLLAVMQVESSFNPLAQSPIPAFGLMQVVPTSAGLDVNQHIFNNNNVPSADTLLDARQNMVYGSNYLALLRDRYLVEIKDPTSRLLCMIAAYNTGAGNVARVFHPEGKPSVENAVAVINAMHSDAVYNRLLRDLPYEETRLYLQRVKKAMGQYAI